MQMRNTPFAHPPVFGASNQYGGGFGTAWDYSPYNPNSINFDASLLARQNATFASGPLRPIGGIGRTFTREQVEQQNRARAKAGLPPIPLPEATAAIDWSVPATASTSTDGGFVPIGVKPDGTEVFTPNKPPPAATVTATGVPVGTTPTEPGGLTTFQLGLFGLVGVASAYLLFFDKSRAR